ncbi:MAG: TonB-dependent receptor [Ignavibacteriaceae bacterium]
MKLFLLGLLLPIIASFNFVFSQTIQHQLDDVIVTAGRTPTTFSNLTRSVIVINSDEIKEAPVNSIQDILQYAAGVDVKQRGVEGVQADVSIRGGTFEETLILIDGVKISDPQTAHHNLNLPITLDNVERIEILKGQGSRIYGPNAFSGVVNIITKKKAERSISLEAIGGENSFYDGTMHVSYPAGNLSNHLSFSKKKSDGYRHNTNFDMINFSYGSSLKINRGNINLLLGYNDKKFGADGFYSSSFPNQWEHTKTKLLNLSADLGNETFTISPKFYFRRNDDEFLLNYIVPSFYQNIHQTNVYGFEIQSSIITSLGTTSFGGEYGKDKIESTNLGDHSREKKGFFAEHKFSPLSKLNFIIGAFAYDYSTIGWKFWPGLDASYNIAENVRLFGSVGKAFRIPSYTELYYNDPVTKGNPNLLHEETLNYEIGINFVKKLYSFELSLFRKEGKNIIDWFKQSSDETQWTVSNISKVNTNGFEVGIFTTPQILFNNFPVYKFSVNYIYLDSDRKAFNFISRYALDYLRHQLIITVSNNFFFDIIQSWALRYENRVNFEDYFLVDTKFFREFNHFELFLKATNLFNKSYNDISSAPLPGRWIMGGIKLNI